MNTFDQKIYISESLTLLTMSQKAQKLYSSMATLGNPVPVSGYAFYSVLYIWQHFASLSCFYI